MTVFFVVLVLLCAASTGLYAYLQLVRISRARRTFVGRLRGMDPVLAQLEYAAVNNDAITVYLQQHTLKRYPPASDIASLPPAHAGLYVDRLRFRKATIQATQVTLTALGPLVFSLSVLPAWKLAVFLYGFSLGAYSASAGPVEALASVALGVLTVVMLALLALPGVAIVIGRAKLRQNSQLLRAYERALTE